MNINSISGPDIMQNSFTPEPLKNPERDIAETPAEKENSAGETQKGSNIDIRA